MMRLSPKACRRKDAVQTVAEIANDGKVIGDRRDYE